MEKQKFNASGLYQKGYEQRQGDQRNKLFLRLKLGIILGVPFVAILLALFIFRLYHIEGPSMEPTLQSDDRVIIEKIDKTWAGLRRQPYVPQRYDVVVLQEPSAKVHIIKRVIGVPGDRVIITGGSVVIINRQHPEGYLVDKAIPVDFNLDTTTRGKVDISLKPGQVFVLGDNRQNSTDSRNFGPVDTGDIVGRFWTGLKLF